MPKKMPTVTPNTTKFPHIAALQPASRKGAERASSVISFMATYSGDGVSYMCDIIGYSRTSQVRDIDHVTN